MKQLDDLIKKSESDLKLYVNILKKWQKAVNLIADSTINDIWNRHILDSAQIFPLISEKSKSLVDLGSGAGFPGLVLAILNKNNQGPLKQIILIESDTKKCLFLKEVIRQLSLSVIVLNQRIEKTENIQGDVITARALAPVQKLLELSRHIANQNTMYLFLKGKSVDDELKEIHFPIKVEKIKSITNSDSCIVKITEVNYD